MEDSLIDGVCLYNTVRLTRCIPVKQVQRNTKPISDLASGRVVFLNEALYQNYQTDEQYLEGLKQIILQLARGYREIIFKFHPRETFEWRKKIEREILSLDTKISVIEEDAAIEDMIEKYKPAAAASYFCSALLTLSDRGIEPIYLYHLIPELAAQTVFKETSKVLDEIGYMFVSDFSEVKDGYVSGIVGTDRNKGAYKLADIITDL